jgi:acetolactate decarboxylase
MIQGINMNKIIQTPLLKLAILTLFINLADAQEVQHRGTARNVMMGINLRAHVSLDTLLQKPGFWGIGPVDSLQGEITVMNSTVFISAVKEDGQIETYHNNEIKAPFLVYSYVSDWESNAILVNINSLKDLELELTRYAQLFNLNAEKPFPFRIKAQAKKLEYHIIMKDWSITEHNHDIHKASKRIYAMEDTPVELLGFYSRMHEGVFTHKGDFIHVHFVQEDQKISGHVDHIELKGKITLALPAIQ